MSYEHLRRDYERGELNGEQLTQDPLALFHQWLEAAVEADEIEPNAMALATVGADGQPRVRFVLLKDATDEGFVFFTNYESRKGLDLAEAPRASLAFWWPRLERQVRVDGAAAELDAAASDAYFASRPHGSQIGAWASRQGQPIDDREVLVEAVKGVEERYAGVAVPRPPYWGGYVIKPHRMEFWQGRNDRLHDRFEYRLQADGWSSRRLAP